MYNCAKSWKAVSASVIVTISLASAFVVADLARGELGARPAGPAPANAATQAIAGPDLPAAVKAVPASWLGRSGRLRAYMETATTAASLVRDTFAVEETVDPGVHDFGIVTPTGDAFYVLSLLPYGEKSGSTLKGYRMGSWPAKGSSRYAPPAGFIEVTAENAATPVSDQFRLADFLTHDQTGVWPKFLVLQPRLLDKLELISAALAERGLPSKLHVMSGFRTPQYNEQGVGKKGGRASMSRHMYGDAADVFVDADGNGRMDDLNGDGKVTKQDAQVLFAVAEGIEADNPDLIGGLSAYNANSAHGPFVHVDARGVKARW